MELSVFFFTSEGSGDIAATYRDITDVVCHAERLGYTAAWFPERHFHPFGGAFPNPALLASFCAGFTSSIALRAGSVVVPLHNPLRIAEEWGVVDALSGGRAGLSVATGWAEPDFVLARDAGDYANRRQLALESMELVERLWRGEEIRLPSAPDRGYRTYPGPVHGRIPLWLSATGKEGSFVQAATRGWNVLTTMLSLDLAELRARIGTFRRHRPAGGSPGVVTVMLHAHGAGTDEEARAEARAPMLRYLTQHADLLGTARGVELSPEDHQDLLEHSYDRLCDRASLIAGATTLAERLGDLAAAGVDEVACLIDFGMDPTQMRRTLEMVAEAHARAQQPDTRRP